jgi:hypothetical protein
MPKSMQWKIESLECNPNLDGKQDFVVTAHWRLAGTCDGHYASAYGSVSFKPDGSAPFTPYNQLTNEQVVEWVQAALGAEQVARLTESVSKELDSLAAPQVVTKPLPWS